ncbi:MAG: efflux transporter periplasmic adaptor subunit, partial [Mesorhizobium sp.]
MLVPALLLLAPLAGCSRSEDKPPEIIRPVLSVVIEPRTIQTFGF